MRIVLWNEKCVAEEEALVPINERAFLYGDGVFTTLLVKEGKIFFLKEHLARFYADCALFSIVPLTINPEHLAELIRRNHALEGEWRLKIYVTGGRAESLNLPKGRRGVSFATLVPYQRNQEKGCRIKTFLGAVSGPLSRYKTMAYLERLYLKQYALDHGYDDVMVASPEGDLMDASFSNLFWTDGDHLYVPSLEMNFQVGVTLWLIIAQVEALQMPIIYGRWRVEDLPPEAALYRCNSLIGIEAITEVDGRSFSGNERFESTIVARYYQEQERSAFVVTKEKTRESDSCSGCG